MKQCVACSATWILPRVDEILAEHNVCKCHIHVPICASCAETCDSCSEIRDECTLPPDAMAPDVTTTNAPDVTTTDMPDATPTDVPYVPDVMAPGVTTTDEAHASVAGASPDRRLKETFELELAWSPSTQRFECECAGPSIFSQLMESQCDELVSDSLVNICLEQLPSVRMSMPSFTVEPNDGFACK